MVNSVVLVGRLTADPEMRYTPNGVAVANFRLAVNRPGRRDQEDDRQQADFIDIVAWRQQAEFCGNYLNKGALVGIEGRIQVRNWETQDGQRRRTTEVVAFRVQALESRAERERRQQAIAPEQQEEPSGLPEADEVPPGDPFAQE